MVKITYWLLIVLLAFSGAQDNLLRARMRTTRTPWRINQVAMRAQQ